MDKAFAHMEKYGCKYCNSDRNMKVVLVKKQRKK